MKKIITEEMIEQACISVLSKDNDYQFINANISAKRVFSSLNILETESDGTGRASVQEVILPNIFFESLCRLNPHIPEQLLKDIVREFRIPFSDKELVVENYDRYKQIKNGIPVSFDRDGEKQYETNFSDDDAEKISKLIDRRNSNGNKVLRTDFSEPEDHFYISLKKQWSYSDARANFEVFREEFVNLTYMNSAWLTYILQTQKKGDIVIGSQSINFAHLIPYLKKMLDFVRKREAEEVELLAKLESEIADDPE